MARLRPTEVRRVVELLCEPAEDVDELAKEVIRALDKMRADRMVWVAGVEGPEEGAFLFGPCSTAKEAMKLAGQRRAALYGKNQDKASIGAWPMHHPDKQPPKDA
jgi:hypothetical protein